MTQTELALFSFGLTLIVWQFIVIAGYIALKREDPELAEACGFTTVPLSVAICVLVALIVVVLS